MLFLLYTSDLVELVRSFGLLAHADADDLQVYCHMNFGSEQVKLQRFRDCADSVSRWMSSNQLKLNPSKTELIWFYSGRGQLSIGEDDIVLFGNRITPVHTARDLGVMLDSNITMSQHVWPVCQNCHFQLRLIRRLGKALPCLLKQSFVWCMHWFGWITVTMFLQVCLGLTSSSYSQC